MEPSDVAPSDVEPSSVEPSVGTAGPNACSASRSYASAPASSSGLPSRVRAVRRVAWSQSALRQIVGDCASPCGCGLFSHSCRQAVAAKHNS